MNEDLIKRNMRIAYQQASEAAKFLKENSAAIQANLKAMTEFWPDIQTLVASAEEVSRELRQANKAGEVSDALSVRGWFIPPLMEMQQVEGIHDEVIGNGDLNSGIRLIIRYCDDGLLERIVDHACDMPAFATRCQILREALAAHELGMYSLSIPAVLAQSEGAYMETLVNLGVPRPMLYRASEWKSKDIRDFTDSLPLGEIVLITAVRCFSEAMCDQFTASVYGATDLADLKKKYPDGLLSRHAVMHGIDTAYASKDNSIRALFLLDTVRAIISLPS